MATRSNAVGKLIFIDLVGSVVWFPIWWYTKGLQKVVGSFVRAIQYRSQSYALRIWIKNFFVPMYGQYDWTGRLISVFMRMVVLIGRLIALAIEALIYAVGVAAWIVAPALFLIVGVLNLLHGAVG